MCKKKVLTFMMAACTMLFMVISGGLSHNVFADSLGNPRVVYDKTMNSGEKVTWDCIWFGEYPQTEIKKTDKMYSILEKATKWNGNRDISIDGQKYRRIKKSDATYTNITNVGGNCYYHWEDDTSYHYFKYEPIKWRILKIENNSALLMADKVLDCQTYHLGYEHITWEKSTIRSWLNGYSTKYNDGHTDGTGEQSIYFEDRNFLDWAFNSFEQNYIESTSVFNNDGASIGKEEVYYTEDKIFLLSESEVCSKEYGFSSLTNVSDEARVAKYSEYAKAMGLYCSSSDKAGCKWWLRSAEETLHFGANVNVGGSVRNFVDYDACEIGVRPVLKLNMNMSDIYTYAGTICNDGNINESGNTENKPTESLTQKKEQVISANSINKTYSNKTFSLNVKTSGDGKLTYKSNNNKVVRISSLGKVKMVGYGKATITIVASETDSYKVATKQIEIRVNPPKAKKVKVKSLKKETIKISWRKNKLATGYQVQISTDKKFKKGVLQRYFSKEQKSIRILLKKKRVTKFYIRIRYYKKGKENDYYGKWSSTKNIKIR